jgi:tripartite motif-containing protein 71
VTDRLNHRVQYFTPTGSFLGKWGRPGNLPGEFAGTFGASFSRDGTRIYVGDAGNSRIQYFRWSPPAVAPASLGRVKALFR